MDCGGAVTGALPVSWVEECAVVISGMPAAMRQSAGKLYGGRMKLRAARNWRIR